MRLALLLWLTGCSGTVCWFDQCVDEPAEEMDELSCPPGTEWETVAKPFLDTWCTSCHASTLDPNDRMGAPQGVDFDTWEGASTWADRIQAVTHGEGATMPPAGGPSDADREAIAAWVMCGAPGPASTFALCDQPRVIVDDVELASPSDQDDLCSAGDGLHLAGALRVVAPTDIMPSCVCAVDGDLTVEGLTTSSMIWPVLREVGGDLTLSDNHGTRDMSFPALTNVVGSLRVERNDASQRLDLPKLASIGGDLNITQRGTGGGFTTPRLASVDGDILIQDNPQLLQVELLRLSATGGSLQLVNNAALADIGTLDTLTRVGGDLILSGSALREFTGLRYVTDLGGDLTLADNPSLTYIDMLHVLETIGGAFTLERMPELTTVEGLHQLLQVDGDLNLSNVPIVDLLALDNIRQIGGAMTVERMPSLQSMEMSVQNIAGGLRINDNLALEGLTGWSYLDRLGNLRISYNPLLREIRGLQGLTTIDGELAIVHNARLVDLDGLIDLTDVGGSLTLHNDDALESLSGLHNLTSIGGDLVITDNASLSIKAVEDLLEAIGEDSVDGAIVLRGEGGDTSTSEESDTGLSSG